MRPPRVIGYTIGEKGVIKEADKLTGDIEVRAMEGRDIGTGQADKVLEMCCPTTQSTQYAEA